MKQIFKKNQVIITALALMICAAGFLQFSDSGKTKDTQESIGVSGNIYTGSTDALNEAEDTGVTIKVNSGLSADNADVLETEEGHQIGEAVMVSTTVQSNFTSNARLVREQRRAQSKETLMAIIDNASLAEEQKQIAVETLVNLTTIAEKENAAELLLEAKGFADPIVNIVDNEVDVVINAVSVSDRQVAQIEDIVTRKTGFEPRDITITAAIQED